MSLDLPLWEERLRATLADHRASRGERSTLRTLAAEATLAPADRARLRALVFDLARSEDDGRLALDWAEDVLRAIEPQDATPPNLTLFSPGDAPRREIIDRLEKARRRLDIAVFTITDDRITRAIMAAAERGVRVQVMADDAKAHDKGSDIFELIRHPQVNVALDREGHMHHKFAIFDERVVATGSFNWTRSASHANHENIHFTADADTVRRFQGEFESLWRVYRS